MPSQAEIEQQQADVNELSATAVAEMALVVMALTGEDGGDSRLVDAIPTLLQKYMNTAASLAVNWYKGLARTEPRTLERKPGAPEPIMGPTGRVARLDAQDFQPRPADLPPREQIESTVWWALSEPAPQPTPQSAEQQTVRQARSEEPPPSSPASAPEPAAPKEQPARSTRAPEEQQARVIPASETEDRARVILAGETESRASIIPADADERQARIISRLAGATQRYVTGAARDTIAENAMREDVRWARHARPDACAFCRLLATREDYLTEESAKTVVGRRRRPRGSRNLGDLYHDDCHCEPVPVRAEDSYTPPDYRAAWQTQYEKAVAEVGNRNDVRAILAVMRRLAREDGGSTH